MSDFFVEIRKDLSEDFEDSEDFIAELHPERVDFDTDQPAEMASECSHIPDIPAYDSNEYVQGLLSNNKFSTEKMTGMLRSSILTLITKFMFGRSIAEIEGQIQIYLQDDQKSPISIDLTSPERLPTASPCYEKSSPAADTSDELNVKLRDVSREGAVRPDFSYRHCSLSPEQPRATSLSPFLQVRRESDADSGYGGKRCDEMETDDRPRQQVDVGSSKSAATEERMCLSVDSLSTLLESDVRFKREDSCENGSTSPFSEPEFSDASDELDDGVHDLVIDESSDTEAQVERPSVPGAQARCSVDRDGVSQPNPASIPADLPGDSEDPRGCFGGLAVCYRVGAQHLECRLCYSIVDNAEDFVRHVKQTHSRFTCPQCFLCFAERSHLEAHMNTHTIDGSEHSNLPLTVLERDSMTPEAERQACLPEETGNKRSTTPQDPAGQEETYGQLLDLSMKKNSGDGADQNKALFSRQGETVSKDGYGQPSRDRFCVSPLAGTAHHCGHVHQQHPLCQNSFHNKENAEVIIKTEPMSSAPRAHTQQSAANRNLHFVPCKTELSEDVSTTIESHGKPMQRTHVHRPFSNSPAKPPLRFSPYSREKLAELAAKFLASRREASACNNGRERTSPDSPHSSQPTRPSAESALTEVNGASSRGVSLSETTLKNRVNAFVKNGGHQAHSHANCHASTEVTAPKGSPGADHVLRSRAGGAFTCSHEGCAEDFACFQALERHSVESHGRYLCEHCGKTFTARPNRDRHVRYHTGERPYKCDLCPQAFFRGDDLKYHRTTRHPAAEPFVCTHCNRNFTWSKDLEKHQRHGRCKA